MSSTSCDYRGGFSNRVTGEDCPSTGFQQCGIGLQTRCCPNTDGLQCAAAGAGTDGSYCCPTGVDCVTQALKAPQCADPAASLWTKNGTFNKIDGAWCCEPGHYGSYISGGGVACLENGVALGNDNLETAVQVTDPPTSCTSSAVSSSTSSSPLTSETNVTSAAPSGSLTQPPQANTGGNGLSGAAIAGIVIAGVAGLAIIIVGIWMLMRKKKSQREQQQHGSSEHALGPGGYYDREKQHVYRAVPVEPTQLDSTALHELDSTPQELDAASPKQTSHARN